MKLPVTEILPDIERALAAHNRVIVQAPPGAGKSTLVPLSLLDAPWLEGKTILMLEPRRLAARSVSARMAELLGEKPGERVGYQVRMERCFSEKTQLLVVTEGILTRMLQSDPALEKVGLIIFDEFHERSLHADLSLALALQSQELLRDDLRIMLMSATLNADALCALLGDIPVLTSEGKRFEVAISYLDSKTPQPERRDLPARIGTIVQRELSGGAGGILVFLPGAGEIRAVQEQLEALIAAEGFGNVFVAALYGALDKQQQLRAIAPPRKGERKIVLATNIAETSLTIEGISVVIDSGLQRLQRFNPASGMNRLETAFISRDSATQRSGRAGRLGPGRCYRLWHESKALVRHYQSEILSADLTQAVLELARWGVSDPSELWWLDRPPEAAVEHAKTLLHALGMLDGSGAITAHGMQALELGVHPRLAHMLLKAREYGCVYEASLLAALLEERDILRIKSSDVVLRLYALHERRFGPQERMAAQRVLEQAALYRRRVGGAEKAFDAAMAGVLLGFAYPERIAKIRAPQTRRYLLGNGKGAALDEGDALIGKPYLVVADLNAQEQEARIFLCAALEAEQLERYFSDRIVREIRMMYNREAKRVEVRERRRYMALVLSETPGSLTPPGAVAEALLEGVRLEGLEALAWSKEALSLRQRVNFINTHVAASELPDFSDEALLASMEAWFLPYLEGKSDLKSCQSLDLYAILLGMLNWEQQKKIDALAPRSISVPSGSKIAIDYSDAQSPVLAVRLQEMFGQSDTPTVLEGKVRLLIHLLSPAQRPMQVTGDLRSFWENTYDEVKKELRGKYKKHYWPDDPLNAQATSRTKKHM